MGPGPKVFADVADTLGIQYPEIIEKDYHIVQVLTVITDIELPDHELVFSGGTCLAKAYVPTHRMSEDIDIKMVPKPCFHKLSHGKQKKSRKHIRQMIWDKIETSLNYQIDRSTKVARDEYSYMTFMADYSATHTGLSALRPEIKIELIETPTIQKEDYKSVRSLYAEVAKMPDEVESIRCAGYESIAIEKFVSLLRRTAYLSRDNDAPDDAALIRHIYDLKLMYENKLDIDVLIKLLPRVIEIDKNQFANRHAEFLTTPISELMHGLDCLLSNEMHEHRYNKFLGPLVYNPPKFTWNEAASNLQSMAEQLLQP
jgi:predicted nucleotidyltransferase component of viral defense system